MSSNKKEIESVIMFEYICVPMNRDAPNHELRSMSVFIYAKDKDDAERIFMSQAHKFFDQDLNITKTPFYKGFREKI